MKNLKIEDGVVKYDLDTNNDGESSAKIQLHLSEAVQEAIAKGQSVEGAKVVEVKFELTKLKVVLDTDKDGEALLELEIDLAEVYDEIANRKSE